MANYISERELRMLRRDAMREQLLNDDRGRVERLKEDDRMLRRDAMREHVLIEDRGRDERLKEEDRMLRRYAMREHVLNEDRGKDERLKEEENRANSKLRNQLMSENSELEMDSTRYGMEYNGTYNETERFDTNSYKTIDQCDESMDISKEILELEKKLSILKQSETEALIRAQTSPFALHGDVSALVQEKSDSTGKEKYKDEVERQSERLRSMKRNNMQSAIGMDRNRRSSHLESTRNDTQSERHWQREGQRTSNVAYTRKETDGNARRDNWQKEGQMASNVNTTRTETGEHTDQKKIMNERRTYEDGQIHMKGYRERLTQSDIQMPVVRDIRIDTEAYRNRQEVMMESDKLENACRKKDGGYRYSEEMIDRIDSGKLDARAHVDKDIRMRENGNSSTDDIDRWTHDVKVERERIESEIEREKFYLNKLMEQNRRLEDEMEIRGREEQQLAERINGLEMAQQELGKVRKEREILKADIERKLEYRRVREKKIELMKLKEQELSQKLDNGNYISHGESTKRMQKMTTQSLANFGSPRIPPFIGIDYKVWRIEVDCIIMSGLYHEILISQALRSALKGDTKRILLTLDPMANSDEILTKLEDVYGTTHTEDSIMQGLFNAKQRQNETTSEWALRLESVMQLAVQTGEIPESKRNTLLKQRFWKGLLEEKLRNNTRVTYESEASFEILRKKTRLEEYELKRQTPSVENASKVNRGSSGNDSGKSIPTNFCSEGIPQQQKIMDKQINLLQTMLSKMGKLEVEMVELKKGRKESENRDWNNEGYRKGFNYNKKWPKKDEGKKDQKENDEKQSGEQKNLNR